jgi:hypothetical protein
MIFNQQETPAGGFIVARTLSGGERKPNLHDAQVRATEMATDDCSMGLAP